MAMLRTELPDGCYHLRHDDGSESWHNSLNQWHRLDGPAYIRNDGLEAYCINNEIPLAILDILHIREEIDYEIFPSAKVLRQIYCRNIKYYVYRIHNPDELVLAILRYG